MNAKPAMPALRKLVPLKHIVGEVIAAGTAPRDLGHLEAEWDFWTRDGQFEPPGDWNVWLMLAGRGYGKTRTGAEWLRDRAVWGGSDTRLALVGATANDVRTVMVEGDSGILATSSDANRPLWEPTIGRLIWGNGAQAYVYSAESPDRLRGPQFEAAWCDELAAWPDATAVKTWTNLRFALRIGERPRLIATTTPRPTAFVRDIVARPDAIVTGGRTNENPLLAKAFLEAMTQTYGGTALGRQELDGELVEDRAGALWTRATIEACRVATAPPLQRVVVGVDPSGNTGAGDDRTGGEAGDGDACGIVVAGVDDDGIAYVIEDATTAGLHPDDWARAVARAAAVHNASCVVAEVNYGGAMVGSVLRVANRKLPIRSVHATGSKATRAEPVSLLYLRGLVRHVGSFPNLEDQLCGMMTRGSYQGPGRSPDRADALVWAVTELLLGDPPADPRCRVV